MWNDRKWTQMIHPEPPVKWIVAPQQPKTWSVTHDLNRVLPPPQQGRKIIRNHGVCNETNVQEINISHQTGKGKSSTQKCPFLGDMLVPWRVITSFCSNPAVFFVVPGRFFTQFFSDFLGVARRKRTCQCQATYFGVEWTPSKKDR